MVPVMNKEYGRHRTLAFQHCANILAMQKVLKLALYKCQQAFVML